jgi:hypothetical protein
MILPSPRGLEAITNTQGVTDASQSGARTFVVISLGHDTEITTTTLNVGRQDGGSVPLPPLEA